MTSPLKPLRGVRVLSLALNLPGPAALMRCKALGASCTKLEPPGPNGTSADPMAVYNPPAYAGMHAGVRRVVADLKTDKGQATLHRELARTDVLLTSFRPSALDKLGLGWKALHRKHPALWHVAIVGAPGERAEEPGHDLTYLADNGLVTGLDLPPTLFADMGGALMGVEGVLQAALQRASGRDKGKGRQIEVALSEAARWLALPRHWGLTLPGSAVGGAHAGYRVYPCKDGRVAVAALEPHFARSLCAVAGVAIDHPRALLTPAVHTALAQWFTGQTRKALDKLAAKHDIPLHTLR